MITGHERRGSLYDTRLEWHCVFGDERAPHTPLELAEPISALISRTLIFSDPVAVSPPQAEARGIGSAWTSRPIRRTLGMRDFFTCGSALGRAPLGSVTHELRTGAARSIPSCPVGGS